MVSLRIAGPWAPTTPSRVSGRRRFGIGPVSSKVRNLSASCRRSRKRFARVVGRLGLLVLVWAGFGGPRIEGFELRGDRYHVFPGDDLQGVVDRASTNRTVRTVVVHPGTYLPPAPRQALVRLHRAHSGLRLVGLDRPTLSAANPAVADRASPAYPAIVNHVLYLGDGLATNTLIQGFRLTGANHFVTNSHQSDLEPDRTWRKGRFYFGDGGAIKIYHRSYPRLRDLEISDNYASPCAGGISIQQEGATQHAVLIEDCVFRNNRAEVTGAALDLLWGSRARVVNCLFVGNVSNTGPGEGENPFTNNGAITIFPRSILRMERCTMTGNRNGVDDLGGTSEYVRCIFAGNTLGGGPAGLPRFELDLRKGGSVVDCVIQGSVLDPGGVLLAGRNSVDPVGFRLEADYVPVGTATVDAGYRPRTPPTEPDR